MTKKLWAWGGRRPRGGRRERGIERGPDLARPASRVRASAGGSRARRGARGSPLFTGSVVIHHVGVVLLGAEETRPGEKFLVDRRRRGETQTEAAARLGIPVRRVRRWETGNDADAPPIQIRTILPHEACLVLRRREGRTIEDVAADAGISAWWVCQIEQGEAPAKRLVRYWTQRLGAHKTQVC